MNKSLLFFIVLLLINTIVFADPYDDYNNFAKENFGAEKEPLIYEKQGNNLVISDGGSWMYVSVYSAAIAWETNLPAETYIEFGTTASYGLQTEVTDRSYYIHLHYLKNLSSNTLYHYRLVSKDERGNIIYSEDRTLTTSSLGSRIRIPEDFPAGTEKFDCNVANATYLVTQDITVNGRAIEINAANITLDLGGKTIIYNNAHVEVNDPDNNFNNYINQSANGVWIKPYMNSSCTVVNGIIKQGAGNDAANSGGVGFSPVFWPGSNSGELAGVSMEYSGSQICGIYANYASNNVDIHHNVIKDKGTEMLNRHQGCAAIRGGAKKHHNLVKRCRHQGLGESTEIYNNEIHIDSWATNSIGLGICENASPYRNNKIMGTGYHIVAIGWNLNDTKDIIIKDNIIQLAGMPPTLRHEEYGAQSSLNGCRITQYGGGEEKYENWLYEGNLISINVKGTSEINGNKVSCQGRGIQLASDPFIKDIVFRNNTIRVIADPDDPNITNASCIVTQGLHDRYETANPIYYIGNKLISNFTNIRLGDDYSSGSNHHFISNEIIKEGNNQNYHTIVGGYWIYNSCKNRFIDNVLTGGASFENTYWDASQTNPGILNYSVEWTLDLQTESDAVVIVKDDDGTVEYFGSADGSGKAYPVLKQFFMEPNGNLNKSTEKNPHTIIVKNQGRIGTGIYSISGLGESYTLMTTHPIPTNEVPGAAITQPAESGSIFTYSDLEIIASADDNDGVIVKVEFYINDNLLGEDSERPYKQIWTPVTEGNYLLKVTAIDDQGGQTTSATVEMNCTREVLESYWGFNEGEGSTLYDSIRSVNGTINGASWVEGLRGSALEFDGIDDYVSFPEKLLSSNQRDVTLAMWVKPENWGSGGTLFDEINGEYWQFNIVDNEWRTRNQFAGEYGTRYNLSIPAISNNQWHHLAFVYSVSQNLKAIYIDGQLADSTNESIFRLTTARTGATLGDGRFSDAFQGIIDEMYFFNRYLNSSEIQTLMNGIIPVLEIENQEDIIEGFNLSQNYPNPFNPSTMINYSLPASRQELPMNSNVTLKIYDILGREVATLVNEHKPAGTYSVQWNGTNSAGQMVGSGIYFYQLKTNNGFVETKKMMLLR